MVAFMFGFAACYVLTAVAVALYLIRTLSPLDNLALLSIAWAGLLWPWTLIRA